MTTIHKGAHFIGTNPIEHPALQVLFFTARSSNPRKTSLGKPSAITVDTRDLSAKKSWWAILTDIRAGMIMDSCLRNSYSRPYQFAQPMFSQRSGISMKTKLIFEEVPFLLSLSLFYDHHSVGFFIPLKFYNYVPMSNPRTILNVLDGYLTNPLATENARFFFVCFWHPPWLLWLFHLALLSSDKWFFIFKSERFLLYIAECLWFSYLLVLTFGTIFTLFSSNSI